jgi:fucose 4-O-acetylase-like acetyltransferase
LAQQFDRHWLTALAFGCLWPAAQPPDIDFEPETFVFSLSPGAGAPPVVGLLTGGKWFRLPASIWSLQIFLFVSMAENKMQVDMAREQGVDAARGILMLYIVAGIHGFFWLNLAPAAIRAVLLFEMPLVFVVSGYAYSLQERSLPGLQRDRGASEYIYLMLRRLSRVLVPYMAYAVVCIGIVYGASVCCGVQGRSFFDLAGSWLNPFEYGGDESLGMLNWHLWFLPAFMLVTVALPFAVRIKFASRPRLIVWFAAAAVLEVVLSALHFPLEGLIKQFVFYLMFALVGYYASRRPDFFGSATLAWVAGGSVILLLAVALVEHDPHVLSMQRNKFPPNYLFYFFSCAWVSCFLYLSLHVRAPARLLGQWRQAFWLRPFVSAGYSIYLWQGLGYTLAQYIGQRSGLPVWPVWMLAVLLSVVLGKMASPIEKFRFGKPTPVVQNSLLT